MGILARQAGWNAALAYVGLALGFVNVVLLLSLIHISEPTRPY